MCIGSCFLDIELGSWTAAYNACYCKPNLLVSSHVQHCPVVTAATAAAAAAETAVAAVTTICGR